MEALEPIEEGVPSTHLAGERAPPRHVPDHVVVEEAAKRLHIPGPERICCPAVGLRVRVVLHDRQSFHTA